MAYKFREPVNGFLHLGAAVAAVPGAIMLLVAARGDSLRLASALVYGLSLVALFSASAAYHLVVAAPRVNLILRKLDHSAIYTLIAGTYTPLCLVRFTGFWRWGLLGIIWTLALGGITLKLARPQTPRRVSTSFYLAMGWLCLSAVRQMFVMLPPAALIWLLLGGIFFTVGAVIYAVKFPDPAPGVFGFHEIWHIFVILGALAHFFAVWLAVSSAA